MGDLIPLNVWLTDAQALETRSQIVAYAEANPRRVKEAQAALDQFDQMWEFASVNMVG